MKYILLAVSVSVTVPGCATPFSNISSQTLGEMESGYTYVPIDPFPVETGFGDSCKENGAVKGELLDTLPDNAVRMLVERLDSSGSVTLGSSKAALKGESYQVTVDYINADTINLPVSISKFMRHEIDGDMREVDLFAPPVDVLAGTETYKVARIFSTNADSEYKNIFNIPIYVGVGLRVSANIYVVGANVNISGIGAIGAEAEAERLRGSLVVQTLGINGKSIAAALPIQSELNRTTAQNAIVAVGSIKSLLYADETVKSPRLVGMYLPFPGGKPLVNALISELSKDRIEWEQTCLVKSVSSS